MEFLVALEIFFKWRLIKKIISLKKIYWLNLLIKWIKQISCKYNINRIKINKCFKKL